MRTRDEWLALLTEADILSGPAYTYDELFADRQFQHNGMVDELLDQEGNARKILRTPIGSVGHLGKYGVLCHRWGSTRRQFYKHWAIQRR